ncbi:MAG: short-chain dehydrogenase [Chloroflexi bacterium]|nr:MAG: short-chain dehydrogenase [Anaerolineaceae bacterium 4572_32.2]RLC80181.1 MAG: short-chain dehydrogenase [Chloroflexota bacterium]RLC87824.1 MAG: short-chain dehydrogenase [Chloroflexota bacterium]HEY71797.1 SDR family oxidoreductase [Thermoflexia bacterium]
MTGFSLEGKVVLVTGSSRGIGRAIGLRLARAGAKVVVSSRKLEHVQAVADEIEAAGGESLAIQAHVGRTDEVRTLVERTVENWGQIDVAINNAATNVHIGPLLDASEGQWDKILDTNVKSVFRVCQAVAPHMEAQGGGKIINIASVAGLRPSPTMGIYSVSKAAVIALTKALAAELGRANIQVNAIAPGIVKTRFSQMMWQVEQIAEPILAHLPLDRFGEPEDVAAMALYLAAPVSDYITGAVFVVDGGMNVASAVG